jgi:hypothetical protein
VKCPTLRWRRQLKKGPPKSNKVDTFGGMSIRLKWLSREMAIYLAPSSGVCREEEKVC